VSGVDDAESFKIVRDALRVMEIGDEEQEALFLLLSVIIHLGNIEFASGEGDRARINNPVLVSTIAKVGILFHPVVEKQTSFFYIF
jgi:myosin heavy subunit